MTARAVDEAVGKQALLYVASGHENCCSSSGGVSGDP